tara:strand:- start:1593 stop:2642 length:1050 start_codon:yes stop_codon:yes gene_type:complete
MDKLTQFHGKEKNVSGATKEVTRLKQLYQRNSFVLVTLFIALLMIFPALPFVEGWMAAQGTIILIYVIAAQGQAVLTGYTGLVSMGHGGFLAIGAYTSALLTYHYGIDLVVGILAGAVVTGLFGMVLALIFLRLSGAFMAVGTLGFAFFIGTIVNNIPFFQGRTGISLPSNKIFGIEIGDYGFYYVSVVLFVMVILFMYSLTRSGVGRALMALRDAENAAQSSGVNRWFFRTIGFTVSAAITGIAGVLSGHYVNYVSSEVYADIWYSADILMASVIGGSAMLMGPLIGGAFVVMIPFFLETMADFSYILKGVALIVVLWIAPLGVAELIGRPFARRRAKKLAKARGVAD